MGGGPDASVGGSARRPNLSMLAKLLVVAVAMFGFGFLLVPLYDKICEVTGVNSLTKVDRGAAEFARNTQVDRSRTVVVEFDANGRGAWKFRPEVGSLKVHPGELVTVVYDLENTRAQPTTGQAIPSYVPRVSAGYFRKLECFCFQQQELGPNESRRFPVVFVVDPKLPKDVGTITLSYTFFEVGGKSAAAQRPAAGASGGQGG
ncbi:MAG: cytochrome c oxidase assembly protein [Burkholderiaceae bacterium]|nr:cytochrome c oxidase assembly protein [Burkholderiaceae bacterium]